MVASLYPHPIACIPLLAPRSAAVSYCKGALWDATAWKPLTNPTDAKQQVSLMCAAQSEASSRVVAQMNVAMSYVQPSASACMTGCQTTSYHVHLR